MAIFFCKVLYIKINVRNFAQITNHMADLSSILIPLP